MPSPEELRRRADALEAQARELRRLAGEREAWERKVKALPLLGDAAIFVTDMEAPTVTPAKHRGPVTQSDGPMAIALVNSGLPSFAAIARDLGVGHGAVKMWDSRRSVPSPYRERLAGAPYFVPDSAYRRSRAYRKSAPKK